MKLSAITYWVMGFAVCAIAICFGYFHWFKPNMDQAKLYDDWKASLIAEENRMQAAQNRVEEAEAFVAESSDRWQQIVDLKTPPTDVGSGGINLAVNRLQLTVDAMKFRNSVQRAVNSQLKRGGVTVVQGPYVREPSDDPNAVMSEYFNYPGTSYPVAIFNLGSVTVRGTWSQISQHVRSWADMPRYLAVADGLTVTGTSPELTATYNLTLVAFIKGKQIAPSVQLASTGADANAQQPAGFGGGSPARPAGPPGAALSVPGK